MTDPRPPKPPSTESEVDSLQDLQAAREAIETVDRQLMELFRERMQIVESVASAKVEAAYPFRDQFREEQVLRRVRQTATEMDLDAHQMEALFRSIMEMAIHHQQAFIKRLPTTPLRVAYQGVEGSFSHLTAQRHYRGLGKPILLTGFETFREAAESVRTGTDDMALLPIENSTAGSINETYDLLAEGGLTINAEAISRVSHCLLGLAGAKVESLRAVISHPQALLQCEDFLRSHPHIRSRAEFDTAGAARKVKEQRDPTLAAIASESAARVFALEVIERDIQTQASNFTRFVEVAREPATCPPEVPCKTSLLLATGHRPGDLADVLRHFASRTINLTKLESRPVPDRPFQYQFYLDLEGHANSAALVDALDAIKEHTRELRILGTYPSAADAISPTGDAEAPRKAPEAE